MSLTAHIGVVALALALLVGGVFAPQSGFAQERGEGIIEGTVTEAGTGDPLPGANVVVEGTSLGAATDVEGYYRIERVGAGTHTLVVSSLSFQTERVEVTVSAGETVRRDVALRPGAVELEDLVVSGVREGQARALSDQKAAQNIKNVVHADLIGRNPDANVAEALQRLPGISIERDQGEGRYVQIRGTSRNLSNISINGVQVPSPESGERSIALDAIPADVLSSIEVSKAITPDMDGDAIGGAVNLNTLQPVSGEPVRKFTLASGYNSQVERLSAFGPQGSASIGQRFGPDNRFGLLVGGSYNTTNRATHNNEMAYDDFELEELELRDYELTRKRLGLTASADYRLGIESRLYLNGSFNRFTDMEYRRAMVFEADEITRELKDRFEEQRIVSFSGGGEHAWEDRFEVDYRLAYSHASEAEDPGYTSIFVQEFEDDVVAFDRSDPDVPQPVFNGNAPAGASALAYDAYAFDELELTQGAKTTDRNWTSSLNLLRHYTLGGARGEFKLGGLYRAKSKMADPNEDLYSYDGSLAYTDLMDDFENGAYFDGAYQLGRFMDPEAVRTLFEQDRGSFELEAEDAFVEEYSEDFEATENTVAGYAMTQLQRGSLTGLVGFRYETTGTDYQAYEIAFDEEGDLLTDASGNFVAMPQEGDSRFNFFLPMVHLKYELTPQTNLRAAWTNTFAKPNYFHMAPYRIINRGDREIELGNPDLKPARATNFDLMAEYYSPHIGVISAGVFYKHIRDFSYVRNFSFETDNPGLQEYVGYEAEQPVNGETADLAGAELNLHQEFTFLPGFANGFGIYANYTYTWSEARLQGATGGEARTVPLPGQTGHVGNLALSYEKYGFTGRISLNYAGAFISEIRNSAEEDRTYDKRMQLDLSLSQHISRGIVAFLEVLNLTNEPLRYYHGVTTRPEQQEYYAWWANLGIRYSL